MESKNCESCGMPMQSESDFGTSNPENKYCKYCVDKEGNLKSFEDKITDFKGLLMKSNDIDEDQAILMAKGILKEFPAWENME